MATYLHTVQVNHTLIHCFFYEHKAVKIMAMREYILTRYNVVVAQNTTFEEVSCNINEYFVSDNNHYRCVDGFNKIMSTNNQGDYFFCIQQMMVEFM